MNTVNALHEVEILQNRLGYGMKMLGAVYEAVIYGQSEIEDYADAIYGVYDYLHGVSEELHKVLESCFDGSTRKPPEGGN